MRNCVPPQNIDKHNKLTNLRRRNVIKNLVTSKLLADNKSPQAFNFLGKKHKLTLTINDDLEKFIKRELRRYRTDHSAVVVIDNETGHVISLVGNSSNIGIDNKIALSSSHPAASLSKIVTAAGLLEYGRLSTNTNFSFYGKGTTLYKGQVFKESKRWARKMSLGKAFAFSNNVIFGKAAVKNLKEVELLKMANLFGFNKKLSKEFNLTSSTFELPSDKYNLAELASGFNRQTLISPVHGAVISSIIANKGILKSPKILKSVLIIDENEEIKINNLKNKRVLTSDAAGQIESMMRMAVSRGTATSVFKKLKRSLKRSLIIGGKTGSISGGIPYGKRDWFISFARPKNEIYGKGISIAVMNINKEKWHVRSAFIARRVIEYFFQKAKLVSSY